jgi:uncharacterized membrane protein (DUF2068 family)
MRNNMHSLSTLQYIALWKLFKGLVLFVFGASLLFLDIQEPWYVAVVSWVDAELMTPRKGLLYWLLPKVLAFLTSDTLRTTAILALVYAVVLAVEGVGVYLERRWAEWLMVVATGSLIPLEVYHILHRFTWFRLVVLIGNCCIVAYLWVVLHKKSQSKSQLSEDITAASKEA